MHLSSISFSNQHPLSSHEELSEVVGEGEGEGLAEDREDEPVEPPCKDARGFRSGKTRLCWATVFDPQLSLLL